jgi:hypothetical protein
MTRNDRSQPPESQPDPDQRTEKGEDELDQALEETFPASDPVSAEVPGRYAATPSAPSSRARLARAAGSGRGETLSRPIVPAACAQPISAHAAPLTEL